MAGLDDLPTRIFELTLGMPTAGATTDVLSLSQGQVVGLFFGTPFAGTLCSVYVPDANNTLRPAYDSAGNALTVACAANRYVALDPNDTAGLHEFALVSNGSESALTTITVHTRAR